MAKDECMELAAAMFIEGFSPDVFFFFLPLMFSISRKGALAP